MLLVLIKLAISRSLQHQELEKFRTWYIHLKAEIPYLFPKSEQIELRRRAKKSLAHSQIERWSALAVWHSQSGQVNHSHFVQQIKETACTSLVICILFKRILFTDQLTFRFKRMLNNGYILVILQSYILISASANQLVISSANTLNMWNIGIKPWDGWWCVMLTSINKTWKYQRWDRRWWPVNWNYKIEWQ